VGEIRKSEIWEEKYLRANKDNFLANAYEKLAATSIQTTVSKVSTEE